MVPERSRPGSTGALLCALAVYAGFVGCGQGEGGESHDGPTGTLVGPISGVSFETETHSGVTNGVGMFRYEDGERVRFFIGDTVLGETLADAEVSLFDLVSDPTPPTGNDTISRSLLNRCSPLVAVVNMAAFLQSLDQDGNPANGIEIASDVAALFESVRVDFAQGVFSFGKDRDLRAVLSQSNSAQLFEGHRRVRSGAFAIEDLYASLGVDASLSLVSLYEDDRGADGEIDSVRRDIYDERAQATYGYRDSDANGEPDATGRTEYDEYGNVVLSEFDWDGDGDVDQITRRVFSQDGDLIRTEIDSDGDGDADLVTTSSYDEIGRVLSVEDRDGGVYPVRLVTYSYDDDARKTVVREDEGGDGSIESITTRFYDESGHLLLAEVDTGNDGTINRRDRFESDARGNTLLRESDRDGDGHLDDVETLEYDGMCRRTYQEERQGDGTLERTTTTVYDEAGREVSRITDSDGDRTPDSIKSYRYDEDGALVFSSEDDDADGIPSSTETLEYVSGALSRVVSDQDADGSPDRIEYYTSESTEGWAYVFDL